MATEKLRNSTQGNDKLYKDYRIGKCRQISFQLAMQVGKPNIKLVQGLADVREEV